MDRIPTYKISADMDGEELDMIAVTANPAIMVKGVRLSADAQMPFRFSNSEERMVIAGPAMIPNMKIYRNDEDGEYNVVFTEDVISQLVEKFAGKNIGKIKVFNDEHKDDVGCMFILEHWIIEDPEMDKSRTFGFTDLPKGTWFVMAKVTDRNFWEKEVKNNEKFGFSIEGMLGLKLKRNTMKKKFANAKLEDGTTTYAPEFAVDQEMYVIDENGDKAPIFDGEHLMEDGRVIVTVGGKITEVKPKAEAEAEMAEEVKEDVKEDVKVEEEIKAEEVVVEEPKMEMPKLDEAAVLAIIQPKLDELYAVIAELKGELMDEEVAEEVMMSAAEKKALALSKIDAFLNRK